MRKTFLEDVLDDLEKKQLGLESCTFVLPGKRGGTFLKQHMAKRLQRNIFAPPVHSIEEFMEGHSGIKQSSNLESLLQLYRVYRESGLDRKEDFSAFIKWGQTLLQDFMAIDGHLLPATEILNYLSAIKELDHWSLQGEKTPWVENYVELWGKLEHIYNRFNQVQREAGRAHQGLIHRMAVEQLFEQGKSLGDRTLVFIGFNALNTAESKIIQHALEARDAQIYWDIDPRYLEDPIHEAGYFIRKYFREWPYYQKNPKSQLLGSVAIDKKIEITGLPKNMAQTKYAGKLLQDMAHDPKTDLRNTALVLADEGLLQPMLKAIPMAVGEVNITMGLPLEKTLLFSFFQAYLELSLEGGPRGWFHKGVLEFLANPYTLALSQRGAMPFAEALAQEMKTGNYLYLRPKMLEKYQGTPAMILFPEGQMGAGTWVANCLSLVQGLKEIHQAKGNAMELEYLYRFHTLFNQLARYVENLDFLAGLKAIKPLFRQLASLETLDFIGEPLSGLQIMGMLESRNLDFGTVIISSVNEGILPAGKSNNSFIPFDVKQQYGLPTHKERDAIYTYHFYRLIQRAERVHILYNTEADVLEGGEPSRLIAQLLTDGAMASFVTHNLAAPKIRIDQSPPVEIEKSEVLMRDLQKMAGSGFSPSSLTNYVRNPMDFYRQNLLRIDQVEDVEEKLAANTFGNIVHNCLEGMYRPLIGTILEPATLKALVPGLPKLVLHEFQKELPGVDASKGRFLLTYHVIVRYLENFIQWELGEVQGHPIRLLALEERYHVPIAVPGLDFPITLKGTLDRVDERDGQLRIIDYKTGRVEAGQVKVAHWEEIIGDAEKAKAFQLLCYAYIYRAKFDVTPSLAGILSFKHLGHGLFPYSRDKDPIIDSGTMAGFEVQLHRLIGEILDPKIPFREKKV